MSYEFPVTRTTTPKAKPDQSNLGFGKYFTDHMLIMDYDAGQGWHDGRIVPYGPISLDPASCVLHYAQMMFEGMKAYRTPDGRINLFRPDMNAKRLNRTNERMCIPPMDEELFIEAVKAAVKTDADWIPTAPGTALYIRPYIISDEVSFSVEPAKHYHFIIILCAVGAYYDINRGGLTGSHIYVEDEYIRAAVGGTGFAKVGGNYAGGMRATKKALENGCKEVLWLDAHEHKYVEEVGTSNAFFMIGDEIITRPWAGPSSPASPGTAPSPSCASGAIRSPSAACPSRRWRPPARTAPSRRHGPPAPPASSPPSGICATWTGILSSTAAAWGP